MESWTSQALTFRRATSDDVIAVRALTRDAYAKWVPIIRREPKPMTADYTEAVREHQIDLMHLHGRLCGLIEMIDARDHLLIENIAVAPDHQRRGLGTKLLSHAERAAVSLGYRTIRLYTNKLFIENIQLYLRRGYVADLEELFVGGIVVHMTKHLREVGLG